jgi:hypothetical protein
MNPADKSTLICFGHWIVLGWLLPDEPQVCSDLVGGLHMILELNPFPDYGIGGLTGSRDKALQFEAAKKLMYKRTSSDE